MLWYGKCMKPFKTCVTQERGEGRSTKKVIKSDAGGGGGVFAAKKCDSAHSKQRDFVSDVLFEWPLYDNVLLYCILYECISWCY